MAIAMAVAAASLFSLQRVSTAFSAASLQTPATTATPLSWRRMPASDEPVTVVFVAGPECAAGAKRAAGSATAMAAGPTTVTTPGGEPGTLDVAVAEEELPDDFRMEDETETMMFDRVERMKSTLRHTKGKFVPYGPKPWDKHQFTKVCIQSRLKVKQAANTKILNQVVEEIRRLSGKHPYVVKAKHNVAAFGWRVGYPCGVAVTLQGRLMGDFLQRLNTIVLPRVRDFEGLYPNSIDKFGNFWMSFLNQEPFRELDALIDDRELVHGFDVGIMNNCLTQPDGVKLMKDYGFPFGEARQRKAKKARFHGPAGGKK